MRRIEQSVKTRDLLCIVARSWKQLVVFSLIGVFLLTGLALYKQRTLPDDRSSAIDSGLRLSSKEIDAIKKDIAQNDSIVINANKRIETLSKRGDSLADRLENSIYLSIDHKAQPVTRFRVGIVLENITDDPPEVTSVRHHLLALDYLKYASSESFIDYLVKANDSRIANKWMRELVTCRLGTDNVLLIEVVAPDMDTIGILADAAQDYILHQIATDMVFAYPHKVEIFEIVSAIERNSLIRQERSLTQGEFEENRKEVKKEREIIKLINDLAIKEEEKKLREKEPSELGQPKRPNLLLFAVGGFVFGLTTAIVWIVFRVSSAGLVYYPKQLANQLKIFFVGTARVDVKLEADEKSKSDRHLLSMIDSVATQQDIENDSMEYMASIIHGLCRGLGSINNGDEENGEFHLALLGDVNSLRNKRFVELLRDKMKTINSTRDLTVDSALVATDKIDGVRSLSMSDAYAILVHPGETKIEEVIDEYRLAEGMRVSSLGIISIDLKRSY